MKAAQAARNGSKKAEPKNESNVLLKTLIAFKRGDFSVRMPVDETGVAGKIADALNDILELNQKMVSEFDRISRAVGKEGKIAQRASIGSATGGWAECIESVNSLIGDLVQPSTEVARVIGAVAKGDLSQTMSLEVDGRPLRGEFLHTARVVNTMVDQLNSFASEVTRVAREVGTEGKLGGQAVVTGVAGTWKDLTESVNSMASNLTNQVRNIAGVTTAVAKGDLTTKITVDARGEILELKNTINTMVDQLSSFAAEVTRVAREVGTEGKLGRPGGSEGRRRRVEGSDGFGQLHGRQPDQSGSQHRRSDHRRGQGRSFDAHHGRRARRNSAAEEHHQHDGGSAQLVRGRSDARGARSGYRRHCWAARRTCRGVGGTWKDLTDSVNSMAGNLTAQVRNIAEVTTAVAKGDLSRKITVTVRGEILELKNTINTMVDQLSSFASEVTRVAREVGTEGKLGGQAEVEGVAGTWRDLTESVNSMAGNLTNQVRNIAGVTTAVAKGDLSTKITVDARGEILELKNTINTMVDQLNSFAAK